MKLVCHENIPGTQFSRGDVIHDAASVAMIEEDAQLFKHFSRVADDAFPDPTPAPRFTPAPAPAKSSD